MTAQTDGQIARGDAAEARREARAASDGVTDIVRRLDDLRTSVAAVAVEQARAALTQAETRSDVLRVEVIATEARDQSKLTNGRVTKHDLLFAEMKGIAQGAGGTGRLLFYMLSAAAGTSTIVVAAMKVLEG